MNLRRTLMQSGLSDDEATVYQKVLENGRMKAGSVIRTTSLKRGHVYNVLNELVKKDLLEKFDINGIAHYRLTHPSHLKQGITEKKNRLIQRENALERGLEEIVSEYNKGLHKPAVQYFEGEDGMEKVLDDALTAEEEIYTYLDIETLITHLPEVNKQHTKKREKHGVKKRGLIIDTPFARNFFQDAYHENITTTKLIDLGKTPPFETIMQIYDDKISYITLTEKNKIGAIIESPQIYQMHRALFEKHWSDTPRLDL